MEPLEFLTELRAKSPGDFIRQPFLRSIARDPRAIPAACRHGFAGRRTGLLRGDGQPRFGRESCLHARQEVHRSPCPHPERLGGPPAETSTATSGPSGCRPTYHRPRSSRVVSAAPRPPAANGCAAGDSAVQRCHVSHARRSADGHSISVRSHRPLPRFVLSGALGINRPQELRKPAVRCASLRDCRQHCRDRYRRREAAAHYDRRGRRPPWMLVWLQKVRRGHQRKRNNQQRETPCQHGATLQQTPILVCVHEHQCDSDRRQEESVRRVPRPHQQQRDSTQNQSDHQRAIPCPPILHTYFHSPLVCKESLIIFSFRCNEDSTRTSSPCISPPAVF